MSDVTPMELATAMDVVPRCDNNHEYAIALIGHVVGHRVAAPDRIEVTPTSLATALEGFRITVHTSDYGRQEGRLDDADSMASALFDTLTRMAALHDPDVPAIRVATEVHAIAAISQALQLLNDDERQRVMHWACEFTGLEFQP